MLWGEADRSLKHQVMPGVTATVLMEGNKFEMEDHRNWMDASYKTYVCSLLDPWPYTLKKGEAFVQRIDEKQPRSLTPPPKKDTDKPGAEAAPPVGGVTIPVDTLMGTSNRSRRPICNYTADATIDDIAHEAGVAKGTKLRTVIRSVRDVFGNWCRAE